MDVRQVLGTNVRRLRLEKGMSQEEFGFAAGIDRTYVSGVERGLRNPSLLLVAKFARGSLSYCAPVSTDFADARS